MPRSQEFSQKFQNLQECYLNALPSKLDNIEQHWSILNNVTWSFDQFEKMHHSVHKLAGSAGGFGLKTLSKEASTLDGIIFECLQTKQIPDLHSKNKVSNCIKKMYQSAGLVSKTVLHELDETHSGKKVLIIDDDDEQVQLIELLCGQLKCIATSANTLEDLAEHIEADAPDLILMDVVFPTGQFAGIEAIKKLHEDFGIDIPVIFMSSRNDLASRLKSYRAGGLGYLTKPFDSAALKLQFDLLDSHIHHQGKILIIDKEDPTSQQLVPSLEARGFHCSHSSNPAVIVHMLERHTPDLLILDLDAPGVNTDEILHVLRQDAKFMQLPILVVTKNKDSSIADQATAHGASGVIHKPFNMDTLLESIDSLISQNTVLESIKERVTINNPAYPALKSHFFYALADKCIRKNIDSANHILVSIAFRNTEQTIEATGRIHIEELNNRLIHTIHPFLSDDESICNISDLHYSLLLSSEDARPIAERLKEIKTKLDNLSVKTSKYQIQLDCCCSAVYLSNEIGSVDQAFHQLNNAIFHLLKQSEISIKVVPNAKVVNTISNKEIEMAVSRALENNELKLTYQPIIDINGEEKIFEALSRINNGDDNTLMPSAFIPFIRENDQKEKFNRQLVQAAVNDMASLKGLEAEEIEIIVKLLFVDKNPTPFLSMVSNILRASRIRGNNRLIFSITEEEAVQHPQKIEEFYHGIKDLNCSFLLDRAGVTPHTQSILEGGQFAYVKLSHLTIQHIKEESKVDIDFVKDLLQQQIIVIAPYIEDNATFSLLWKIGIRYFQGYFVRKPESSLHFDFKLDHIK